jgi:hypothetical protein
MSAREISAVQGFMTMLCRLAIVEGQGLRAVFL